MFGAQQILHRRQARVALITISCLLGLGLHASVLQLSNLTQLIARIGSSQQP